MTSATVILSLSFACAWSAFSHFDEGETLPRFIRQLKSREAERQKALRRSVALSAIKTVSMNTRDSRDGGGRRYLSTECRRRRASERATSQSVQSVSRSRCWMEEEEEEEEEEED